MMTTHLPSFYLYSFFFFTLSDNPRRNEGGLLPDAGQAVARSEPHRLFHSARHLSPRVGVGSLQAGVWTTRLVITTGSLNEAVLMCFCFLPR